MGGPALILRTMARVATKTLKEIRVIFNKHLSPTVPYIFPVAGLSPVGSGRPIIVHTNFRRARTWRQWQRQERYFREDYPSLPFHLPPNHRFIYRQTTYKSTAQALHFTAKLQRSSSFLFGSHIMGKKRKQQLAVARTKRFKNGWILYFISYLYHYLCLVIK